MYDAYTRGKEDALEALGLEKNAYLGRVGSRLFRASRWLHKKMPTWTGTKREMFGQPVRFAKEIAKGRALSKGSVLRESFKAETPLAKAMFYGYPVVESTGIMLDDEGDKAKRIGESVGRSAIGLAVYRPFGMVGSMLVDPLGVGLGGAVGQTAGYLSDKVRGKTPPPNNELG